MNEPEQRPGVEMPALLHPLLRFMVAAVWVCAVFWGSGFVYLLFPEHNLLPGLCFRLLDCLLTLGGFAFFVRVLDFSEVPLAPALGLAPGPGAVSRFVAGGVLGAFLITAGVLVVAAFGSLQLHLHLHHWRLFWVRAAIVTALFFFGAVMEELSFRGYPFQKLTQGAGAGLAVIILSLLFAIVHLDNPEAPRMLSLGFLNTFLIGVLLALARIRTGSLWFSIGLHFCWNLFQGAVFGLPVSGLHEFDCFASATVRGPAALTGGKYGLEASATCTILLVVATPLLWWMTARQTIVAPDSQSSI